MPSLSPSRSSASPPTKTKKKFSPNFAFHSLTLPVNLSEDENGNTINKASKPTETRQAILADVAEKVRLHQHRRLSQHSHFTDEVNRKNKWSSLYSNKLGVSIAERERRREMEISERKNYRPRTVNTDWIKESDDSMKKHAFQERAWDSLVNGRRNVNCFLCWKGCQPGSYMYCCDLCPSVCHRSCTTGEHGDYLHEDGKGWRCPDCVVTVNGVRDDEARLRREIQNRRDFFFAALKCQAYVLMWRERNWFRKKKKGIIRLQGVVQGIRQRRRFMDDLTSTYRSFRIKVCDYRKLRSSDADGKCDPVCMLSIFNNNKLMDLDDAERQLYRFDTQTIQRGTSGRWNEIFTVYSMNCKVDFAFTVVDKDDIGRCDFLGQNHFDGGNIMKQGILHGRRQKATLKMGHLEVEPRETSNRQPVRMDGLHSSPTGRITVEIQPVSNIVGKVGQMEEMLSALINGAKKKWWVVLIDSQLMLFSNQGDARPKQIIPLKQAHVMWHEKIVIKVQMTEQTWFFICHNKEERQGWFNKMTNKYWDSLVEGTRQFLSASGEGGGEGERTKRRGKTMTMMKVLEVMRRTLLFDLILSF